MSKQQQKEQANREKVLPSIPKGETVGNVVIDGKGGNRCRDRNSCKEMAKNRGSREEAEATEKKQRQQRK